MVPYTLNMPTKVYFGREILKESLEKERSYFSGNLLIVTTGRSLIKFGHLDKICALLRSLPAVNEVFVFDEISSNPLVEKIDECISFGIKNNVSVVVGFGGGSALDAAKAVAAGIGMKVSCRELFDNDVEPSEKTLPIVAVPTTAGTGSELSKAAILSDDKNKIKKGLRGRYLFPSLAIVDSLFTETVPFSVTMETGFDALTHAIESYISKAASPYTKMLSETAIKIIGKNLPLLAENLNNSDARAQMSYASMIMGINLGNASTCLPHRMQYPLGAYTNTSHGAGLAAIYSAWLYYEADVSLEKLIYIMSLLGYPDCTNRDDVVSAFSSFTANFKLPSSLKELGVQKLQLDIFCNEITGNIKNDPVAVSDNVIQKIYNKAF